MLPATLPALKLAKFLLENELKDSRPKLDFGLNPSQCKMQHLSLESHIELQTLKLILSKTFDVCQCKSCGFGKPRLD